MGIKWVETIQDKQLTCKYGTITLKEYSDWHQEYIIICLGVTSIFSPTNRMLFDMELAQAKRHFNKLLRVISSEIDEIWIDKKEYQGV